VDRADESTEQPVPCGEPRPPAPAISRLLEQLPPPDQPAPPERWGTFDEHAYRWEKGPRWALVGAGAGALGGLWLLSTVLAGLAEFDNSTEWLAVPMAGPWITLGARDSSSSSFGFDDIFKGILAVDGLAQLSMAGLLLGGLAHTSYRLVPLTLADGANGLHGQQLSLEGRF